MTSEIPRVLHVMYYPMIIGGIESVVMNWYRHIDRTQIQFDFLIPQFSFPFSPGVFDDEINDAGGRVYHFSRRQRHFGHLYFQIKNLIQKEKYLAVHIHSSPGLSDMARLVSFTAAQCGVPIRIFHSHSMTQSIQPFFVSKLIDRFLPLNLTHRFACSIPAGEMMFGRTPFQVIRNAVDTNAFRYNPVCRFQIREKYKISQNSFVLGHVGRFDANKNQNFLLDVLKEVKKMIPNTILLYVGDGGTLQDVEKKAHALGLENSVFFAGAQPVIAPFYSAMDYFLLPSILEGFGNVNIEAQCSGLPCLLSDGTPSEAKLLDSTYFESLNQDASRWCARIIETMGVITDRSQYSEIILKKGWDIHENVNSLFQFYLSKDVGVFHLQNQSDISCISES